MVVSFNGMGQRMVMEHWGLVILDFAQLHEPQMAITAVVALRGNIDPSREGALCTEIYNHP